jgi:hypothetical protein
MGLQRYARMNDANNLATYAFAGVGALVTLAWLVAYLVPATRRRMLDWVGATLLQVMAVVALWWYTHSVARDSAFWTLLASSWTLNALATIGWGILWWLAGRKELPAVSWVDVPYAGRYLLAFLAFGSSPDLPWLYVAVAAAVAAIPVWLVLRSAQARGHSRLLGKGIYTILDAALACAAFFIWRRTGWHAIGFITLAFIAYGVANWINLLVGDEESKSRLAAFFWPMSDIFAGTATLYVLW